MLNWLVFAAVGKLLITLWTKFPIPQFISDNTQEKYIYQFIKQLHGCGLCSGCYIYGAIALFFGVDIFQDLFGYTTVIPQIAGNLVTGAATSWLVFVFSEGWKSLYQEVIII